jgi:hypothetical protein
MMSNFFDGASGARDVGGSDTFYALANRDMASRPCTSESHSPFKAMVEAVVHQLNASANFISKPTNLSSASSEWASSFAELRRHFMLMEWEGEHGMRNKAIF